MNRLTESRMLAMVEVVSRYNGIPSGKAGFELWGERNSCRTENTCATMYCRAAGKLLAKAERMGLVRHEQHGPAKLWYANAGVEGRKPSP